MSTRNRRIALAALLLLALPLVGAKCPGGAGDDAPTEVIYEEGWVPTPDGAVWATYALYPDHVLFQGDMRIELDALRAFQSELPEDADGVVVQSTVVGDRGDLWPDGVVPYDAAGISETFPGLCSASLTVSCVSTQDCAAAGLGWCNPSQESTFIQTAIAEWNNETDFQLVPASAADLHVLEFRRSSSSAISGCYADIGYSRPGFADALELHTTQGVWIDSSCSAGIIAHEIGHAVGFYHEQARDDREFFVEIRLENTDGSAGVADNFKEHGTGWGEYDYRSIMHYRASAFSDNTQDTIAPRIPMPNWIADVDGIMGQRMALSKGDIAAANALVAHSSGQPRPDGARALFERRGTFPIVPEEVQTADVDGDGTLELVGLMKGPGSAQQDGDLVVGWLQADGEFAFEVQSGGHCVGQEDSCAFGDVDGDGADDLVELDYLTDRLLVSLSVNGGFAAPAIWQTVPESAGTEPGELWLADIDGDCDEDAVIIRRSYNVAEQVWVAESTGLGFEAAVRFESNALQLAALQIAQVIGIEDMDFDGKADLVVADRFGDVWVHRSDGTAFVEGELRAEGACHTDFGAVCTLQDMNGSNYPDLVVMGWTSSHWEPWGLADHPLRRLRLFMNDGFSFSNDPEGRFNTPCLDGTLDSAGNPTDKRPAGCVAFFHEMDCLAEDGCLFADVNGDFEPDVIEPFGHDEGTGGDGVYVSINTNAGNTWNAWADGNVPPPRNAGMCTPQPDEEPDSPWIEAGTLSFEKVIDGGTDGVFGVATTGDLYEFEGGTNWRLVAADHRDYFGGASLTAVGHDGRAYHYFEVPTHESWGPINDQPLDSNRVLTGPGGTFATLGQTGELFRNIRCGLSRCWEHISGRRWRYAIGGMVSAGSDDASRYSQALYSMNSSGVWSWNENMNTWSVIGPHAGGIWAGGDRLYAQNHETALLYSYNRDAGNIYGGAEEWTPIGGSSPASYAVSLDGETLVELTSGHRVRLYSGSPNVWIDLQDPRNVDRVFVAGNKVWSLDADNGRLRYLPLD